MSQEQPLDKQKSLSSLLRTPEQEAEIAARTPEWPLYRIECQQGEKSLLVYGDGHFYENQPEKAAAMKQAFEMFKPELVLIEGTYVVGQDESLNELSQSEVLRRFGEQGYLAKLAQEMSVPVRTWDIIERQLLTKALRAFPTKDVLAWGVFQGAKHVLSKGELMTEAHLREVTRMVPGYGELMAQEGMSFDALSREYAGVSLVELTMEVCEPLATPRGTGKTNRVIRFMNEARDAHALEVIEAAKDKADRVFVGCGGSHAVTWEPALEAMYSV